MGRFVTEARRAFLVAALVWALAAGCAGPGATERAPGRENVRTVMLGPAEVLPGEEASAAATVLSDDLAATLMAALPRGLVPAETALFKRLDHAGGIWSASPLNAFDFSGVAWGGGVVATLVTDRHALVSAHVPRPVGSELKFVTAKGWPVTRRVAERRPVANLTAAKLDLVVLVLDEAVPGDVMVYPLGAMAPDVAAFLGRTQAPLIVTYPRRQATIGTVRAATDGSARLVLAAGSRRLGLNEAVGHSAKWGDSGHPWFWALDGQLILAGHTHTNQGAGAGPNYADARVRAAVMAAVAAP